MEWFLVQEFPSGLIQFNLMLFYFILYTNYLLIKASSKYDWHLSYLHPIFLAAIEKNTWLEQADSQAWKSYESVHRHESMYITN